MKPSFNERLSQLTGAPRTGFAGMDPQRQRELAAESPVLGSLPAGGGSVTVADEMQAQHDRADEAAALPRGRRSK